MSDQENNDDLYPRLIYPHEFTEHKYEIVAEDYPLLGLRRFVGKPLSWLAGVLYKAACRR